MTAPKNPKGYEIGVPVPCDASPTGYHMVRVRHSGERAQARVSCDCLRPANMASADLAEMAGQRTCRKVHAWITSNAQPNYADSERHLEGVAYRQKQWLLELRREASDLRFTRTNTKTPKPAMEPYPSSRILGVLANRAERASSKSGWWQVHNHMRVEPSSRALGYYAIGAKDKFRDIYTIAMVNLGKRVLVLDTATLAHPAQKSRGLITTTEGDRCFVCKCRASETHMHGQRHADSMGRWYRQLLRDTFSGYEVRNLYLARGVSK